MLGVLQIYALCDGAWQGRLSCCDWLCEMSRTALLGFQGPGRVSPGLEGCPVLIALTVCVLVSLHVADVFGQLVIRWTNTEMLSYLFGDDANLRISYWALYMSALLSVNLGVFR